MKFKNRAMRPLIAFAGMALVLGAASMARADTGPLGLAPWALIGGNPTAGETYLRMANMRDYRLRPEGNMQTQVVGLKVRIAGDAAAQRDALMPQISLGLRHTSVIPVGPAPVFGSLSAKSGGTDLYLSATKLLPAQGVLFNATLRATKPGQHGLPGLGSASYRLQPELSVAYLLSQNLAIGAEYRFSLREDDGKDVFIAWAPNKHLSLTLAYVGQGRAMPGITMNRRQSGGYLSAQLAF